MGLGMIVTQECELLWRSDVSPKSAKQLTLTAIQTIDMFLVGAISYIVAVSIYKLFIGPDEQQFFPRIRIEKLADLEKKIIGVASSPWRSAFWARLKRRSTHWPCCTEA
jgi:uncharacterized membrane protein YqhA